MEDCLCASKSPNKILAHRQSSIQKFNPCVQVLLAGDLYLLRRVCAFCLLFHGALGADTVLEYWYSTGIQTPYPHGIVFLPPGKIRKQYLDWPDILLFPERSLLEYSARTHSLSDVI